MSRETPWGRGPPLAGVVDMPGFRPRFLVTGKSIRVGLFEAIDSFSLLIASSR